MKTQNEFEIGRGEKGGTCDAPKLPPRSRKGFGRDESGGAARGAIVRIQADKGQEGTRVTAYAPLSRNTFRAANVAAAHRAFVRIFAALPLNIFKLKVSL